MVIAGQKPSFLFLGELRTICFKLGEREVEERLEDWVSKRWRRRKFKKYWAPSPPGLPTLVLPFVVSGYWKRMVGDWISSCAQCS